MQTNPSSYANNSLRAKAKRGSGVTVYRCSTNLHPAVGPKHGLLDTPMLLAFQKTGALAAWRVPFRLLEKTAVASLNSVDRNSSKPA